MPKSTETRGPFWLAAAALAATLTGCSKAVVLNPAGDIAAQQGDLVVTATLLMLVIIVPVILLTLLFAWKYRQTNTEAEYDPEWHHSTTLEMVIWSVPLIIIIVLGTITWISTHKLDPYRPLDRISATQPLNAEVKPLEVQVVSLDWKWLFFYPEQGIATVNELAAPVDRPILFKLTASKTMSAFYVPDLAGMIYTMPGMETQLNAVINKEGTYKGLNSHYNGAGFSGMTFKFLGLNNEGFDAWVQKAKDEGQALDAAKYLARSEVCGIQELQAVYVRLPQPPVLYGKHHQHHPRGFRGGARSDVVPGEGAFLAARRDVPACLRRALQET